MKYVMIGLVKLYRKFISPIKPPCCRFTPTCSAYALEAFQKRGFFVGFILTFWRILRCNPFSKGGYDPVPEKGFRNKPTSRQGEDANKTDITQETETETHTETDTETLTETEKEN